jgi:putative endonuclease
MFLASKSRVLYVDVTGFLMARVLQHKTGEGEGLTPRYKVNRMVHFEVFQYVNNDRTGNGDQEVAAGKKVAWLEANNPSREDLAAHLGGKSTLMARADSSPAEAGSE